MNRKQRRLIRLAGISYLRGYGIPIFESNALNRAITAEAQRLEAERTRRRYQRADNRRNINESLAS